MVTQWWAQMCVYISTSEKKNYTIEHMGNFSEGVSEQNCSEKQELRENRGCCFMTAVGCQPDV